MIYNPYVGMRVRFIDSSMPKYLNQTATILKLDDLSYGDSSIAIIQFDYEVGSGIDHDFYLWRLAVLDPDIERKDRERMNDQQRRKEHADKYL